MGQTRAAEPASPVTPDKHLSVRQAAFIGVGGVFGTLTVEKVISSGGTALAVAAEPALGRAGYWLMSITALFATAGATNAGLYPAAGLSERLAETGQFPPLMARKVGGRASAGLLIQAAAGVVLVTFVFTTLIHEPASIVTLLAILLLGVGLDYGWKRTRSGRRSQPQVSG